VSPPTDVSDNSVVDLATEREMSELQKTMELLDDSKVGYLPSQRQG
jgi:hypothetical protein